MADTRLHNDCDGGQCWACERDGQSPIAKPDKIEEHVNVAVWWPNEGYGGGHPCEGLDKTDHAVNELIRLGYGKGGKSSGDIHVIRTVREIYIRKPEASQ